MLHTPKCGLVFLQSFFAEGISRKKKKQCSNFKEPFSPVEKCLHNKEGFLNAVIISAVSAVFPNLKILHICIYKSLA